MVDGEKAREGNENDDDMYTGNTHDAVRESVSRSRSPPPNIVVTTHEWTLLPRGQMKRTYLSRTDPLSQDSTLVWPPGKRRHIYDATQDSPSFISLTNALEGDQQYNVFDGSSGMRSITMDEIDKTLGLTSVAQPKSEPLTDAALLESQVCGTTEACEQCRLRKIRCNGATPCQSCNFAEVLCKYRPDTSTRLKEGIPVPIGPLNDRRTSRENSPLPFQHNYRTASHSPNFRFFHNISKSEHPTNPLKIETVVGDDVELFQYIPLSPSEIRLLRISYSKKEDPIHCTLKAIDLGKILATVLDFQALSYAWNHDHVYETIFLDNAPSSNRRTDAGLPLSSIPDQNMSRPFKIHKHLHDALKRIRQEDAHTWIWVDAICIDQNNASEKNHQIPKMPEIYSSAWNVIVWLGEADEGRKWTNETIDTAMELLPKLLNLQVFDSMLEQDQASDSIIESWVFFSAILQLPWFTRRWVIQEIACARRLSLRIGNSVVSWVDFADAVELFFEKLDRIRVLYNQSPRAQYYPDALVGVETSGAKALMDLSRNIFRKNHHSRTLIKLHDLESLVLSTVNFAVTEIRDVIYALLHLANDVVDNRFQGNNHLLQNDFLFFVDYSQHPVDIYSEFVRYCIKKSRSIDIVCRPWALWPRIKSESRFEGRTLPSWINVASYNPHGFASRTKPTIHWNSFVGPPSSPTYAASRQIDMTWQQTQSVLTTAGLILGRIKNASARIIDGTVPGDCLTMLGWYGDLEHGIPDRVWRCLVANRTAEGRMVPGWYRRACALALTKLTDEGDLNIPKLVANRSHPSTMIEYLKRAQDVVRSRRFFCCSSWTLHRDRKGADAQMGPPNTTRVAEIVGLGPRDIASGDLVCILFGCSVPVILRPIDQDLETEPRNVKLVGEAYVHDHMEGEIFVGMTKEEIRQESSTFRIH